MQARNSSLLLIRERVEGSRQEGEEVAALLVWKRSPSLGEAAHLFAAPPLDSPFSIPKLCFLRVPFGTLSD